jgi:signal transduction histidine kinase
MIKHLKLGSQTEPDTLVRLLIGYRWVSLVPPLIWSCLDPAAIPWAALLITTGLTLFLTLSAKTITRLPLPWLGVDLVTAVVIVWFTGASQSPYYLYSLTPILTAALFFQIQGGLITAAVYSGLYLIACATPQPVNLLINSYQIISQLLGFFLIGPIFGHLAQLLQDLQKARNELGQKKNELAKRNRDLRLVRELSLVMQSSVDPAVLQESILRGMVNDLGYQRVMIGLYDQEPDSLSSWITVTADDDEETRQLAHTTTVSLVGDTGPLARALKGKLVVEVIDGEAPTATTLFNEIVVTGPHYMVLPLSLRGQPIGVIIIDRLSSEQRLAQVDRVSLDTLATHTGVALGSMRLCIDHAQQAAITEERNRIAIDLHDNVSQILYGLAYGLEACAQMLPGQPDIREVLNQLLSNVTNAQSLLRQTIFDIRTETVTSETFAAGLHRQLHAVCPNSTTVLRIDLPGDFDQLDSMLRDNLYQIAREALANAAKHAQAAHIVVKLHFIESGELELRISDDGEGFSLQDVPSNQHLGLNGIAERTTSLNGKLNIHSTFGEGTLVTIKVPTTINTQKDELTIREEAGNYV